MIELRKCQSECLDRLRIAVGAMVRNFLAAITPGAGKTAIAAIFASEHIGRFPRVWVVCPSASLRLAWSRELTRCGLDLDHTWDGGRVTDDFSGAVVTYQMVTQRSLDIRAAGPSLVIFDEIHHALDEKAWGVRAQEAFGDAKFRLLLTGTPWGAGGQRVAWVNYARDDDGVVRAQPDYKYGYADGIADNIVRPVVFMKMTGEARWMHGGERGGAAFSDQLSDEETWKRLSAALDPDGGFMRETIVQAHRKLVLIRRSAPRAGAMLVAKRQGDARRLARTIKAVTGETPVVVVSDDPEANTLIERFRSSSDQWLVSVRMVSEGVDIPRLRVLVYGTNITTELFFRQVVGRAVRSEDRDPPDARAYVFIPEDPRLLRLARLIHDESQEGLCELEERQTGAEDETDGRDTTATPLIPLDSSGEANGLINVDGAQIQQGFVEDASRYIEMLPPNVAVEDLAAIFRRKQREGAQPAADGKDEPQTMRERIDGKRARVKDLAGKVAGRRPGARIDFPSAIQAVNADLIREFGCSREHWTEEHFDRAILICERWLGEPA